MEFTMEMFSGVASPLNSEAVIEAIQSRRSIRAFRSDPVSRELVESLLELAARAPSGSNIQPWKAYVCAGEAKARLTRDLLSAHYAGADDHREEYQYYPKVWRDPYLTRRRTLGKDLYRLLGIPKGDVEQMSRQHARNYEFFGAPVGIFFTLQRDLEVGSWLDLGMFIQSLMIGARAFGLDTCPQQAFAKFHRIIREGLEISNEELVVCGLSLGYADLSEPVNQLKTGRAAVSDFVKFQGI